MTEEIKKKIEDKVESYSFQVPYNGTKDFYNETKAKSFADGAEFCYSLAEARIKELEALLERASGLVGNPGTNISSSTDMACEKWHFDYKQLLNK